LLIYFALNYSLLFSNSDLSYIMSLVAGPGLGRAFSNTLPVDKHVAYVVSLDKRDDEYQYWLTEHLRLNGVYWGLVALHVLGHPDALPRDGLIDFVLSCWDPISGGFGAAPGHDPHMLYTCSAVQILALADALAILDEPVADGVDETKRARLGNCKPRIRWFHRWGYLLT
jgi:geranylgeranyl transferase type-2 subunit beta